MTVASSDSAVSTSTPQIAASSISYARRRAVWLLLPLPLVALGALVYFALFHVPEGPLATFGPNAGTRLADGEIRTWGIQLPTNDTQRDIVIDSIEPVSVQDGVEIIGLTVALHAIDRPAPGIVEGYPPEDTEVSQPHGAVIPGIGTEDEVTERMTILFGVRRIDGFPEGLIEGVRVKYRIGNRDYETVIDARLRVVSPEIWESERQNR